MDAQLDWLLEGPPWVWYRALVDLAHEPESSPDVQAARRAMLEDPQVSGLVRELRREPRPFSADTSRLVDCIHNALKFLADVGVRVDDMGMRRVTLAAQ